MNFTARTASTIARWVTAAGAVLALARVIARVAVPPALVAAAGPAPATDNEHIELYYKARDDIKEQIASADARASTILTIELALSSALIIAAPIIGGVLAKVASTIGSLWSSHQGFALVGAVVECALTLVFVPWFVLATLGAYLDTARVLNSDFRERNLLTRRRDLVSILLHPQRLFPTSRQDMDRLGSELPFSPYGVVDAGALLSERMRTLPISDALLGDLTTRACIAKDKRLALHDATRALSIQLLTVLVISFDFVSLFALTVR